MTGDRQPVTRQPVTRQPVTRQPVTRQPVTHRPRPIAVPGEVGPRRARQVLPARCVDPRSDQGSIIPLVLGFFVIALLLVGGSVAASDAFVGQRDVQSICDGTVLAAAAAVDVAAVRGGHAIGDLQLGPVQAAADSYLARDGSRQEFEVVTGLSADAATVTARCSQRRPVALGQFFGLGDGIVHIADSTARTRVVR